jgi:hypothetical protein
LPKEKKMEVPRDTLDKYNALVIEQHLIGSLGGLAVPVVTASPEEFRKAWEETPAVKLRQGVHQGALREKQLIFRYGSGPEAQISASVSSPGCGTRFPLRLVGGEPAFEITPIGA